MPVQVVDVRLRDGSPVRICDTCGLEVAVGDYVIIEWEGLKDCGLVVRGPYEGEDQLLSETPPPVLYKASPGDVETMRRHREEEHRAAAIVRARIRDRDIPMKMITCEYAYDGSKLKVYYTADKRVDFRDLVRDLAHEFRTRIEMKQIGVRDAAGMVGGFGDCGRALCCSSWLTDFRQVTVKMAKDQNLALNPNKITGVCGRLKCCLAYELEFYQDAKDRYPRVGAQCESRTYGVGVVKDYNPLRGSVVMAVSDKLVEVPLDDLVSGFQTASKRKPASRQLRTGTNKQPGGEGEATPDEKVGTTDAAEENIE